MTAGSTQNENQIPVQPVNQGTNQGGTDMNSQQRNSSQVSPDRQAHNFLPQIPCVHRTNGLQQHNSNGQNGVRPNVVGQDEVRGNQEDQNGGRANVSDQGQNGTRANAVEPNGQYSGRANGGGANGVNPNGQNGGNANGMDANGQNRIRPNGVAANGRIGGRANGVDANGLNEANEVNPNGRNEEGAIQIDQNGQNGGRFIDVDANGLNGVNGQNGRRVIDVDANGLNGGRANGVDARPNVPNNNVLLRNQERYDARHNGNVNDRPHNRQRINEYEPYDQLVGAGPLFAGRHNPIRLQDLQREDAIEQDLDFKYLDLQIMRIVIPTNKDTAKFYHGRRSNNQTTIRFTRLFLMRVVTDTIREDHKKVAYVMEARNMNQNLFQNALQYRDNGAITVGSVLRYASPYPITTYMRNNIPMLNSNTSVVVLKTPRSFLPIPMMGVIEANKTEAFVITRAQLDVFTTTPVSTSCRGKLCDKQRVNDWNNTKTKGCGCFEMHANAPSMALLHTIRVTNTRTEQTLDMPHFSSTNFSNLYMTGTVPPSASCTVLDKAHHEQGIRLIDCMNDCVNFINNHGGFTVIGWYKRGLIDDKSLITLNDGETEQVQSGDVSHHIVSIMPSEHGFLERRSQLHRALTSRKFDVHNMHGA